MKRKIIVCFAVLCTACFMTTAFAASDGDEGEPIPLEVYNPGGDEDPIIRGLPNAFIEAFYNSYQQVVNVHFLTNIGEVGIRLVNQANGSYTSLMVDSQNGGIVMPLFGYSGFYRIEFHMESGIIYSGHFLI